MQRVGRAEALNGCDLFPVVHHGQAKARIHAPAVHMHRTCAALPVVAALLRSGESNGLTEAIQQRRPRIDAKLVVLAVDVQRDRDPPSMFGPSAQLRSRGLCAAAVLFACAGTHAARIVAAAVFPVVKRNVRRVGFEGPDCGLCRIGASVRPEFSGSTRQLSTLLRGKRGWQNGPVGTEETSAGERRATLK